MTNKHTLLNASLFSAAFLIFAAALIFSNINTTSGAGGRFSLITASSTPSGFASTTVAYLDFTDPTRASSTLSFPSANSDHLDLNVQFNASSTDSTLQFVIEHSDDNVDWFCEIAESTDSKGTTTTHTYGAKCPIHQWTPGEQGISRRSFPFTDLGTRFMRVHFGSKDGNGSIYAEVILRKPN